MTSPLRRKRLIIVLGRSTPARTPAKSLSLVALLLVAGLAPAQNATVPWSAAAPTSTPIRQLAFQQPAPAAGSYEEKSAEQTIQLEPPGPDRLFRLESEDALKERWEQELKSKRPGDRQIYPDEPVLTRDKYYGRNWPTRTCLVEPNYLCYNRLLFEQLNAERYGWDLGPVGVALSPLIFYGDVLALPYHLATDPFRGSESNAGYALPGDPVPLLLYPPQLSTTGTLAETASLLVLLAIFP